MAQIFKAPRRKSQHKKQPFHERPKVRVTIDRLDHHGKGVVSDHQPVIFVEGGLPGEDCEVLINEQKARLWFGQVTKVHTPSPSRKAPFCPHFNQCGGCDTQYAEPREMLSMKQEAVAQLVQRVAGADDLSWEPPIESPAQGYRRKTRLAIDVRDKTARKVGFRARQSKTVVDITECRILTERLQKVLSHIRQAIAQSQQPRVIGHIELFDGANAVEVLLNLTGTLSGHDQQCWRALTEQTGAQVLLQDKRGNLTPLSSPWHTANYQINDHITLLAQPGDFVQVNDQVNQQMIARAIDWLALSADDNVLDLFCGTGNFSLAMAQQCQHVTGIEGIAKMVQHATHNAQRNGIANCTFVTQDLNQPASLQSLSLHSCNKVLLDPAREGAFDVMAQLVKQGASHILYVSCNPATFARDARVLLDNGYQIKRIALMDMFPNTRHSELMALFVRNATQRK